MANCWARPAFRSTVNLFRSGFTLLVLALLWPAVLQAQLATGTVDFDVVSLHEQTEVTIFLSDNTTLVLLRDYVVDDGPGKYTWIGFVQDDVNGRAYITVNAPNAIGTIQTSTKLYELVITEAGSDPVQEIDPQTFPTEAEPVLPPIFSSGFEDDDQQSQAETVTADCNDTPAGIDVMVLYSDDATAESEDIEAEIRLAIEMANDSFLYSKITTGEPDGIELKVNLVHTQMVQVDENPVGGVDKQLDDFAEDQGGFKNVVHSLRDQYKADLALLIVEKSYHLELKENVCGIAYMSGNPDYAFGIVRRTCIAGHSFTHEMGHLFGANHDKYVIANPSSIESNFGYVHLGLAAGWRTVMAYDKACAASGLFLWCPRLGFFSSPDHTHDGIPRGTPDTDNRKQLISAAPVRACYRSRPKLTVQKLNKANGQPTLEGLVQSSSGNITPAIDCGLFCQGTAVAGTTVELNATDANGWKFIRWAQNSVCGGSTNPICSVQMDGNKTAIAEFAAPVTLTVQKVNQAGGGAVAQGLVKSTSGNITPAIDCGSVCQAAALAGTLIELTASDTPPWIFVRWDQSGACAGSSSRTCTVTLNSNQTARAVYAENQPIPMSASGSSHSCYLEIYARQYNCDGAGQTDSGFVNYQGELGADYGGTPESGGGIANIKAQGQVNVQPGQASIKAVLEGEATGQWFARGQQSLGGFFSTQVNITSSTLPSGTPVNVRVTFYFHSQHSLSVSENPASPAENPSSVAPYILKGSGGAYGYSNEVLLGSGAPTSDSLEITFQSQVGSSINAYASVYLLFQWMEVGRTTKQEVISASVDGPYITALGGLNVQFIQN